MEESKILRINELARKSRTPEGLTEQEKAEQAVLRQEYRDSFKRGMLNELQSITIVDKDGTRRKIVPKDE